MKEQSPDTGYNLNEPQKHYARREKPVTTEHILYDCIYLKMSIMGNTTKSKSVVTWDWNEDRKWAWGFFVWGWKRSKISLWWWLYNSVNLLKKSLNGTLKRGAFCAMSIHFNKAINENKALGGYKIQVLTWSRWRPRTTGWTKKQESPTLFSTELPTTPIVAIYLQAVSQLQAVSSIRFYSRARLYTMHVAWNTIQPLASTSCVHEKTKTELPPSAAAGAGGCRGFKTSFLVLSWKITQPLLNINRKCHLDLGLPQGLSGSHRSPIWFHRSHCDLLPGQHLRLNFCKAPRTFSRVTMSSSSSFSLSSSIRSTFVLWAR